MFSQPDLRRTQKVSLFYRRKSFVRALHTSRGTGLNLNKNDHTFIQANDIQLNMPATPVTVKNSPAPQCQGMCYGIFAFAAWLSFLRIKLSTATPVPVFWEAKHHENPTGAKGRDRIFSKLPGVHWYHSPCVVQNHTPASAYPA